MNVGELFGTILNAFASEDMRPPVAVILESPQEGMRVLSALSNLQHMTLSDGAGAKPVEHPDGSVWMEITVYGIKVRWPAQRYALAPNRYVWR